MKNYMIDIVNFAIAVTMTILAAIIGMSSDIELVIAGILCVMVGIDLLGDYKNCKKTNASVKVDQVK